MGADVAEVLSLRAACTRTGLRRHCHELLAHEGGRDDSSPLGRECAGDVLNCLNVAVLDNDFHRAAAALMRCTRRGVR